MEKLNSCCNRCMSGKTSKMLVQTHMSRKSRCNPEKIETASRKAIRKEVNCFSHRYPQCASRLMLSLANTKGTDNRNSDAKTKRNILIIVFSNLIWIAATVRVSLDSSRPVHRRKQEIFRTGGWLHPLLSPAG